MSTGFRWFPLGFTQIYLDLFRAIRPDPKQPRICAWNSKTFNRALAASLRDAHIIASLHLVGFFAAQ